MRINIFLNDKYVKNKYVMDSIEDYRKRCSKFVNIKLFYKLNLDLISESTSYNINATKNGRYIDSQSFSGLINNCLLNRFKNINVLFECDCVHLRDDICFFNVDILKTGFLYVLVIEQIYRGYKIINNEPYHK